MVDLSYTLLIFAFVVLNVLGLLLKIPLLSIIFGLVSFGVVGVAVGSTVSAEIVLSPYPQLLLLLTVVVCWLIVAVKR